MAITPWPCITPEAVHLLGDTCREARIARALAPLLPLLRPPSHPSEPQSPPLYKMGKSPPWGSHGAGQERPCKGLCLCVGLLSCLTPRMGAFIDFKPEEQGLCVVRLYVFVAPVLGTEWAWHKTPVVPCPENFYLVFFIFRGIPTPRTSLFFPQPRR